MRIGVSAAHGALIAVFVATAIVGVDFGLRRLMNEPRTIPGADEARETEPQELLDCHIVSATGDSREVETSSKGEPEAAPSPEQPASDDVGEEWVAEASGRPDEITARLREIVISRSEQSRGVEILFPVGGTPVKGQFLSATARGIALMDREGETRLLPWGLWPSGMLSAVASSFSATGDDHYDVACYLARNRLYDESAKELDTAAQTDESLAERAASLRATFPVAGSAVLPVVADASISAHPVGWRVRRGEQLQNTGRSPRLKIKRFENQPVLRFDFSALPADVTVTEAVLEVRVVNDRPLNHVCVGTLHVPWNEGRVDNDVDPEGACFLGPSGPDSQWRHGITEADFATVTSGNGGDANSVSRAKSIGDGWLAIAVDPYVVHAAREHGQTLVLTDETGIQDGDLTNCCIGSRESGESAARLRVSWDADIDVLPPGFTEPLVVETGPLPGTLVVHLPAAGDDGIDGHALGYRVRVDGRELPRANIPRPSRRKRGMLVRDLSPGKEVRIEVEAFDKSGNSLTTSVSALTGPILETALSDPQALHELVSLPEAVQASKFAVSLADGLTFFDPLTGNTSPLQTRVEEDAPAETRVIGAVRGEIIGLQVLIKLADGEDRLEDLAVEASDMTGSQGGIIPASAFEFHREHFVKMERSWIADILPVLKAGETFSIPSQPNIPNQRMAAVYVDVIVNKATVPGVYTGKIVVAGADEQAVCPIALVVRDVVIPDEISHIVEMNAYGHSSDLTVFHETYRLLHKHRLSYNALGYGQSRATCNTTPWLNLAWNQHLPGAEVRVADWREYERFYGPILSGEIAQDLPRKGQPATHWYLPFHCEWPYPLSKVNPQLWDGRVTPNEDPEAFRAWVDMLALADPLAEDHFDKDWRDANVAIAQQFGSFFAAKGWSKTKMQIFNNHKYYFRSGSISLWTMDEPQYGRDFRALDFQNRLLKKALADGGINSVARADVSRTQFMGDRMDGSAELVITSKALYTYPEMHKEMNICNGVTLWWYGGEEPYIDPASYVPRFFWRWSQGCDGAMPEYTTFGGTNDWDKTHSTRVVRFEPETNMPVASFRMKAYRRAQQDMELLNLLAAKEGFNRWHLRDLLKNDLSTETVRIAEEEDFFYTYKDLSVAGVTKVREMIVATLLER